MAEQRWKKNKSYKAGKLKVWASAAEARGWRVFVSRGHEVVFNKGWHKTMAGARRSASALAKKMR